MKKVLILIFTVTMLAYQSVSGQFIQDGINHLYAGHFKAAEKIFAQISGTTPTSPEATYWLGQVAIEAGDGNYTIARKIYESAPALISNAALILVGKGHIDLLENKTSEAKQQFEMALSMTRTKKGDDPTILNAIGRANVDAKSGNLIYAIEKLELAAQRDPKNANIFLNLGDAYRKANPGQGGGQAYSNYITSISLSPTFAFPHLRLAKLFETQKNWPLVLENLNSAISKDPNFSPAYYELFYYHFYNQEYVEAEKKLNKYIGSKMGEIDPQDNYLYGQLCWAKKDFDCAIERANNVINELGEKTKARTYKLIAYAYVDKGDTASAKKYIDSYFEKEKAEAIIPNDFILKGKIYSTLTGDDNILFESYVQAAMSDSVYGSKMKRFEEGVAYFKRKGDRKKEASLKEIAYNNKKNSTDGELFNIALSFHQAQEYPKAIELFSRYSAKNPDSIFGHLWSARVNYIVDTTMLSCIPHYEKTLLISASDKLRYKNYGIESGKFLAGYHNNILNDKATAISYLQKALEFDTTNVSVKELLEILQKVAAPRPANQPPAKQNNKSTTVGTQPTANDKLLKK